MSASPLYDETSPEVIALSTGKQRLKVMGLNSVYRLSNGWVAHRRAPDNGWARSAYWTIADRDGTHIGGGEARLTRAIANTLNHKTATIYPLT